VLALAVWPMAALVALLGNSGERIRCAKVEIPLEDFLSLVD
jgi:hypothetical protein